MFSPHPIRTQMPASTRNNSASHGDAAAEVRNELLLRLLEMLKNTPGVTRIESQLLLHPHGAHQQVFENAGFEIHERIFMEWPLRPGTERSGARWSHSRPA